MDAGGTSKQAERQEPVAATDLMRADTPVPDSAAESAETPDAADNELKRRLSEQGWNGATIKSEPLSQVPDTRIKLEYDTWRSCITAFVHHCHTL